MIFVPFYCATDHLNAKLGLRRTEKQVRDKINEMKIFYRSVAAKMAISQPSSSSSKSGETASDGNNDNMDSYDSHWPYFKDMAEIMTGNIPVSTELPPLPKTQPSVQSSGSHGDGDEDEDEAMEQPSILDDSKSSSDAGGGGGGEDNSSLNVSGRSVT